VALVVKGNLNRHRWSPVLGCVGTDNTFQAGGRLFKCAHNLGRYLGVAAGVRIGIEPGRDLDSPWQKYSPACAPHAGRPACGRQVGPKSSEASSRKEGEAGDASVQSSMQPDAARRLCSRLKPEDFCHGLLNQDLEANVFSSGRPATKRQMIRQTRSYLASTQKRPDVVQSFFKETHVAYAAA